MANRYWVGGDGTWNNTSTSNWSATSGGTSGASVPTSSDNVYFDSNSKASGTLIVTFTGNLQCLGFFNNRNATNPLKVISTASDSVNIWGPNINSGLEGGAGDYLAAFCWFILNTPSTSDSDSVLLYGSNPLRYIRLPSNIRARISFVADYGAVEKIVIGENCYLRFANSTRVKTMEQVRNSPSSFTSSIIHVGTFNTDSTAKLRLIGSGKCLNGVFIITSNSPDSYVEITALEGDSEISTIYSSINKMVINPAVSGRTIKLSSPSGLSGFNESTITTIAREPDSLPFTLSFSPSSSYQFNNFSISGDTSTVVSIRSSTPGVRSKINKLGGGIVSTNYVQVQDMQPSPDNTWISYNSTNLGNNYQWYFDSFTKPTSTLFFGSHV